MTVDELLEMVDAMAAQWRDATVQFSSPLYVCNDLNVVIAVLHPDGRFEVVDVPEWATP